MYVFAIFSGSLEGDHTTQANKTNMFITVHFSMHLHVRVHGVQSVCPRSAAILTCLSNTSISIHITWNNHSDKIWNLLLCTHKPLLEFYSNVSNNTVPKLEHKLLSSLHPWQGLSSDCHRILPWLTPVKSDNGSEMLAHCTSQGKPSMSDICYYRMNWWLAG